MDAEFLGFDPRLIEESVFAALYGRPEAQPFHRQRAKLYEIPAGEQRERAFDELHHAWFGRLRLADPIEQALREQPMLFASARSCVVLRALGKKQEGAELFVRADGGSCEKNNRTIRLLLRAESLLRPAELLEFLRREFSHIVDMVDPLVQYEPAFPPAEGGPTHDALLRERYKVLWDTTINGRMVKRGWLPASRREEYLRGFARAFPMLGAATEAAFGHFFDAEAHTHSELVAFAQNPRNGLREEPMIPRSGARCPLCAFPTYTFEPQAQSLGDEILATISKDFPAWRPSHGLCTQCADLYRASALSMSAARLLPGGAKLL